MREIDRRGAMGDLVGCMVCLICFLSTAHAADPLQRYPEGSRHSPGTRSPATAPLAPPESPWFDARARMTFVWVPGGCFEMGCHTRAGSCRKDESPAHEVCLDGFWIGERETTQAQWNRMMAENPSRFRHNDAHPVEQVSYTWVMAFIRTLNQQSPHRYDLPTEAQWEYACRARGRRVPYAWGDDTFQPPAGCGTCDSIYKGRTGPAGSHPPNRLGVYDMGGNVREWCRDTYDDQAYARHLSHNPVNRLPHDGPQVVRGGAFSDAVPATGCSRRWKMVRSMMSDSVGFRLVVQRR